MTWLFVRYVLGGRDKLTFWVIAEAAFKGVEPGRAMATIRRRAAEDAIDEPVADCRRR